MRVTFLFYCNEIRGSIVKSVEVPEDATDKDIEDYLEIWGREQIALEWTRE